MSRSEPSVRPSGFSSSTMTSKCGTSFAWRSSASDALSSTPTRGEKALRIVEGSAIDLIVLDLGLPDMSGVEVLGRIRADSDVPVIVLTARSSEPDRVLGLTLGADDYVAKPFSPRELAARVEAVLRRTAGRAEGDARVRRPGHRPRQPRGARRRSRRRPDGEGVRAPPLPRGVAPTGVHEAQLLNRVWNSAPGWQTEATVSEHVHRVRRKIEVDPKHPRRLVTVRGTGYRFDP